MICQTESCPGQCQISNHIHTEKTIRFQRQGLKDSDRVENITIYPSIVKKHRLGILVKIQDITRQMEIERQMVRADRLASPGQLSGGIAHEIRNPLAGIKLFLDLFADEDRYERTEDEKEIIDEIDANINKINGIIKRVLTFSNPAESEMNDLDINKLIVESLDLFSEKLEKSNITKKLYLDKSISLIKCDYISMQQVITNLTLNAIYATGDMGGILSIKTSRKKYFSLGIKRVFIEIKDTGTGIDKDKLEKIFDPFFTTKPKGTGLGLSISHQIVEQHKGKLSVKSIPGKGASFIIELPYKKET